MGPQPLCPLDPRDRARNPRSAWNRAIQRLADRVSAWFVLAVLGVAALTFFAWWAEGPEEVLAARLWLQLLFATPVAERPSQIHQDHHRVGLACPVGGSEVNLSGEEALEAAPLAEPPPLTLAPAALAETALRERLDLVAVRWAVDVLERARRLHRRTRWLPVGVELGIERESESGVRLTGPTVELALPIFDSGRATQALYEAELSRARSQAEALELRIRSEVREAPAADAAASALAALYRDTLIPLRREALDLAVRESHQMLVGAFELLAANDELLEAEVLYIDAAAESWRSRLELERAIGRTIDSGGAERPEEEGR